MLVDYALAMESDERAGNNLWREIKSHSPNHSRSWNPCYGSKLIGSTHPWRTCYNFPCHTVPVFKQGGATVRAHRPGIGRGERCYPDQSTTSCQGRVGDDTPLRAIPVLNEREGITIRVRSCNVSHRPHIVSRGR